MSLRFQPARGASVLISSSSRGPTGAAATIAAGSATALAAGSSPTVTNSGSSSAATFNFGIPRGADAGIKWLYDSTTSMADPGSGDIRFNHATLSSVTAIAVSNTGSGVDVSDYVAAWDDSTNTTKGHIMVREEAAGVAAIFSLSAVTDNGDWLQLTVTYVGGSLSLTAADPLYVVPLLIGNKGTDGAIAGSLGSTDNLGVRTDGAGGATLQAGLYINDDSGNLSPATNDTGALGTSSLKWSDLFLASGAVVNFNSGNITITHSAGDLAIGGGSFTLTNTGLHLLDTNASHDLIIAPGSDLTADRTLTLTTGDSARTITISGDATISQDYSSTGSPTFANPVVTSITTANTGLHILDTNASHDLVIVPGSDLTADRNLTLTTGDAARTLTISGDHTLPAGTSAVLAGAQTLTGGFKVTPFAAGTKSSGTYTPLYSDGNFQTATNGGAHTLAPQADDSTIIIQYTNNGSAGAVTTSGFSKVTGSFTTTNGDDFFAYLTKVGSFSHLNIVALQ